MRLINVTVFLNIEKNIKDGMGVNLPAKLLEEWDDTTTKYAILSHRWTNEVNYDEMVELITMESKRKEDIWRRTGFQKIINSCEQAEIDGLEWLWVDTCCIDKRSSSELSEAINSMYRWYSNSTTCYAYLHDVDDTSIPMACDRKRYHKSNGWPEWFSRGWTLQELIAPKAVRFFNKKWNPIGDKNNLAPMLHKITGVPTRILEGGLSAQPASVAQIMSWAADRETTRVEDRAYSLMGLFRVHMPMLYGEGRNAFHRLQLEIIRMSNDQSIFAWGHSMTTGRSGSILADDPSFFADCHDVSKMEFNKFVDILKNDIPADELLPFADGRYHTYSVTNSGIQVWLPIAPIRCSKSVFEVMLACCHTKRHKPITIALVLSNSVYYRYFGIDVQIPRTMQDLQQLQLGYRVETHHDTFTFKFDYKYILRDGFILKCIYPSSMSFIDDSLTLSCTADVAVMVYSNSEGSARFAIAVGYCLGGDHWAHVVCDDIPAEGTDWPSPYQYAQTIFDHMRLAGPDHFLDDTMREAIERGGSLIKNAHLPQSVRGIQVVYKRSQKLNGCSLSINIVGCIGMCELPGWQVLTRNDTPGAPDDMVNFSRWGVPGKVRIHYVCIDGLRMPFLHCRDTCPVIELGDYGDWDNKDDSFEWKGNIFDDLPPGLLTEVGVDAKDLDLPIKHAITSMTDGVDEHIEEGDVLLQDLGEILENARAGLPDDYQVRLWQIMQDARSGISKHEIQLVQPTAPEKEATYKRTSFRDPWALSSPSSDIFMPEQLELYRGVRVDN
ncbi:hypothetical protein J3A83DRAFT_4476674 [Scleroderma citrinum]